MIRAFTVGFWEGIKDFPFTSCGFAQFNWLFCTAASLKVPSIIFYDVVTKEFGTTSLIWTLALHWLFFQWGEASKVKRNKHTLTHAHTLSISTSFKKVGLSGQVCSSISISPNVVISLPISVCHNSFLCFIMFRFLVKSAFFNKFMASFSLMHKNKFCNRFFYQ